MSGKAQKDGMMYVSMSGRGGATTEGYVQKTKGAIKTEDGWQSLAEATKDDGSGGFNFGRITAMRVQTQPTAAAQAKSLLDSAKSITKADGAYSGDLTEEGAKAILNPFPRPPGGAGDLPQITVTEAKASVKFWIKDGILTKFEIKSTGKTQFGDQDARDTDRTTTVEIQDVGATKIEVPDEARKKLS
jgi:hypothetical protein